MTASYQRAGLAAAEIEHVANLVAAVEAADPTAPWVAVDRRDLLAVVEVLDRLVDRSPTADVVSIGAARLVIVGAVGQHVSSRIVIPDLDAVLRVLRGSGR